MKKKSKDKRKFTTDMFAAVISYRQMTKRFVAIASRIAMVFPTFLCHCNSFQAEKTFQKWNHTANAMSEGLKLNDPKPKYNFDAFETTPRSFVSTMKAKSNLRIEKHESWQKRNRDSSVLSYPRLWAWSLRIKGDFFGANAKEKKLAWTTNKLKTYLKLRQWDLWYITKRRICIKVFWVWKELLLA